MSLAPGSVCTGTHAISKVHTFSDLLQWGCLRSPLSIGGAAIPMLRSSFMEVGPWPLVTLAHLKISCLVSPVGKWAESSFIYWYSLYTQLAMVTHIGKVTALHCLLKVGKLGAGKISYIFVLLSAKEINFCMAFEVRCWVATLCQLMVLLDDSWWIDSRPTTVHLPWAPHWVPIFVSHGPTTPFRGGGSCAGPTAAVDR